MTKVQHSPDRFELYEQAAQTPELQAKFLRALIEDESPRELTLGEDFCGAGAVSRAWLALDPQHRAVCVDHDDEPLQRLAKLAGPEPRLTAHRADVQDVCDPADLIAVLNFSICELQSRETLLAYLRHARARLTATPDSAGILALDIYGGVDAFALGESEIELRNGVRYVWEQREADPMTAQVVNAMHFHPEHGPALMDAFVYHWRLWSVPELRDAMTEAGFTRIEIHDRFGDAVDDDGKLFLRPIESADDLDENFVVYVVARAR